MSNPDHNNENFMFKLFTSRTRDTFMRRANSEQSRSRADPDELIDMMDIDEVEDSPPSVMLERMEHMERHLAMNDDENGPFNFRKSFLGMRYPRKNEMDSRVHTKFFNNFEDLNDHDNLD